MDEADWAGCRDPRRMLDYHRMKAHPRRLRLLAAACARRVAPPGPLAEQVLVAAERYADGTAGRAEFLAAWGAVRAALRDGRPPDPVLRVLRLLTEDAMEALTTAVAGARDLGGPAAGPAECDLIRCVFGRPARIPALDPAWRTEAAVALARGAYDDRAFDRMPILADALEDAGCADPAVLAHCRGPGPHARGCWVVDGLLGR